MDASVRTRVRALTARELGIDLDELRDDASFAGELEADSLELVSLIMSVEAEFEAHELAIPDDQASEIDTVDDAVAYIEALGIQ